jgi:hypothetical protein
MNGSVLAARTTVSPLTSAPSSTSRPSAICVASGNSPRVAAARASSSSCASPPWISASDGGRPPVAERMNAA